MSRYLLNFVLFLCKKESKCFPSKRAKVVLTSHLQTLQTSMLKSSRSHCLEFLLQTPPNCSVRSPHSSSPPRNGCSCIFQTRCCGWYNELRAPSCQRSASMQQVNYSCVHFFWRLCTWKIRWFPHALPPSLLMPYKQRNVPQGHCWASFPWWSGWGAWGINLKKRIRSLRKRAPNAFKQTISIVAVHTCLRATVPGLISHSLT